MNPIRLTERRSRLLLTIWRVLGRLAVVWALAMIVVFFTGLWAVLPPVLLGCLVAGGLAGVFVLLVVWWAESAEPDYE